MTTLLFQFKCPQNDELCVGKKECKLDKSKGCAIENFEIMQIEMEDAWSIY